MSQASSSLSHLWEGRPQQPGRQTSPFLLPFVGASLPWWALAASPSAGEPGWKDRVGQLRIIPGGSNLHTYPISSIWSNLSHRFSTICQGRVVRYCHCPNSSKSRGPLTLQCGAKAINSCMDVNENSIPNPWPEPWHLRSCSAQYKFLTVGTSFQIFSWVATRRATSASVAAVCRLSVGIVLASDAPSPLFSISTAFAGSFLIPRKIR